MSALFFFNDSFTMALTNPSSNICRMTLYVNHIENINAYLAEMTFNPDIAGCTISSFEGDIVIGSLVYDPALSPIQFYIEFTLGTDIIAFIQIDFAFNFDSSLRISNGIYGNQTFTLDTNIATTDISGNITFDPTSPYSSSIWTIDITYTYTTVCFNQGTNILTPTGYKLIETLNENDEILTGENNIVKIKSVINFSTSINNNLFCLKKDSIDINIPNQDLYMSGHHAIKIKNEFHHIKCLYKNSEYGVKKIDNIKPKYYHIQLDNWFDHTIVANGIHSESLYTGKNIIWVCRPNKCIYFLVSVIRQNKKKILKKMKS